LYLNKLTKQVIFEASAPVQKIKDKVLVFNITSIEKISLAYLLKMCGLVPICKKAKTAKQLDENHLGCIINRSTRKIFNFSARVRRDAWATIGGWRIVPLQGL
jgi:hypothetical protein